MIVYFSFPIPWCQQFLLVFKLLYQNLCEYLSFAATVYHIEAKFRTIKCKSIIRDSAYMRIKQNGQKDRY